MSTHEKRDLAYALAKEAHGDNAWSALWGSASVLLTEKYLDVIIRVIDKK